MVLDIYKLNGEVPGNVMAGDTADISTIASIGWYDWIKFYDHAINSVPEDKYYLGRYFRLAIDIGPALTEKNIEDKWRGLPPIHLSFTH